MTWRLEVESRFESRRKRGTVDARADSIFMEGNRSLSKRGLLNLSAITHCTESKEGPTECF